MSARVARSVLMLLTAGAAASAGAQQRDTLRPPRPDTTRPPVRDTLRPPRADTTRLPIRDTLRLPPSDSARRAAAPVRQPIAPRVVDPFAPPISPRRAFLYSLAVPGLGQTKLRRTTAGAIYVAAEAVSIVMLGKTRYDLEIAKRRIRESLVQSWRLDGDGRPVFDANGPVPADTVRSRYAQPANDELRSRLKARRLHYEDWVALLLFTHLFSGADAFVSAHLWDLPRQVEMRTLPSGATGVGWRLPWPR